jgi:integral membrane sensor domain MASE1
MAKSDSKHPIEAPARHVAARLPPLGSTTAGGVGAMIAIALGVGLFLLGVVSGTRSTPLPMPLTVALCLAGALEAVLGWFTLRRVRAAWAFATSIAGTAAVAFLFSAPKIRNALEVELGVALLPAMVGAVACVLLAYAAPDVK